MSYYVVTVLANVSPAAAEASLVKALAEEGFELIGRKASGLFRVSSGKSGKAVLLSVIHPGLAEQAVSYGAETAVVLPFAVLLMEQEQGIELIAADPQKQISLADEPRLAQIGGELRHKLVHAMKNVAVGRVRVNPAEQQLEEYRKPMSEALLRLRRRALSEQLDKAERRFHNTGTLSNSSLYEEHILPRDMWPSSWRKSDRAHWGISLSGMFHDIDGRSRKEYAERHYGDEH